MRFELQGSLLCDECGKRVPAVFPFEVHDGTPHQTMGEPKPTEGEVCWSYCLGELYASFLCEEHMEKKKP